MADKRERDLAGRERKRGCIVADNRQRERETWQRESDLTERERDGKREREREMEGRREGRGGEGGKEREPITSRLGRV